MPAAARARAPHEVYLDQVRIVDGQRFDENFIKGLANSTVFTPLLSAKCLQSFVELGQTDKEDFVLMEWMVAIELKQRDIVKAILPITIEMQDVPGYAYLPADIEMNAGETYNIRLVGSDEFHTWSVADGNGGWIANISLNPNAEQTVSFTAPAAGTYEIICLPHQANDMVGTLTVN